MDGNPLVGDFPTDHPSFRNDSRNGVLQRPIAIRDDKNEDEEAYKRLLVNKIQTNIIDPSRYHT